MGYKGTIRSVVAAARRYEREEKKRKNELERRRKEFNKMQELEQARFLVEEYETHIGLLTSFHKEATNAVDWNGLIKMPPLPKISYDKSNEISAKHQLDSYSPTFLDKKLGRSERKRIALEEAVKAGIRKDREFNDIRLAEHQERMAESRELKDLGRKVLEGKREGYIKAVNLFDPFSELYGIGNGISWSFLSPQKAHAILEANSTNVVPKQEKYILKSGKLGEKQMAKGKYWELYQDHVCSAMLRVARELFAILPISEVVIDTQIQMLNPQTGYMENTIVVSALIPKPSLNSLNFQYLDCSDALGNFTHNMSFSKTKGFSKVESIA